jgi:hypothetical protein
MTKNNQDTHKVHIFFLCEDFNEWSGYCEPYWSPSFFDSEEEALKYLQENWPPDDGPYESLKEYQENEWQYMVIGVRV